MRKSAQIGEFERWFKLAGMEVESRMKTIIFTHKVVHIPYDEE